jgi:DNA-binding transcriptional MerR regulator
LNVASRLVLPDKLYFKIGEVATLSGVKQHVLRYWESEFPSIRPQKSKSNQRLYRRRDVEAVIAVKHLLYDQKFTIEGAKKHLKEQGIDVSLPPPDIDEVASRARSEALAEMDEKVASTEARLIKDQEKQLLRIRQELTDFQKAIKELEQD